MYESLFRFFAAFPPNLYAGLGKDKDGHIKIDQINDIAIILANVIQLLLGLAGVLAVIFITYSGIMYVTSEGDPGKTQRAKSSITTAVLGLILASGAYILVQFVSSRF